MAEAWTVRALLTWAREWLGERGGAIAGELRGARADLVERSGEAAGAAGENGQALAPGRVRVFEGDLFAALPEKAAYDAVLATPPYVPEKDRARLSPEIVAHEPPEALFAGDGGLAAIRGIVADAGPCRAPGGFFGNETDP